MQESNNWRIVLMGKGGSGKSSLGNTIFGESIFEQNSNNSKIRLSKAHTKIMNGRNMTLVEMPGIFTIQTQPSKKEQQRELMSCLIECAPGPHAFLLVLPVERFTKQEQAVVDQIKTQFGDKVLQFTTVVFTHGDQLPENMSISEFVRDSAGLTELVQACGGRCHVVDNKYWKDSQEGSPRSNVFQVKEILGSIEKTVSANNDKFFTNEMLKRIEGQIETEKTRIQTDKGLTLEESRKQAKTSVLEKYIEESKKPESIYRYVKYAAVLAGVAGIAFMAPTMMQFFRQKPPLRPVPTLQPPPPPPVRVPSPPEDPREILFDPRKTYDPHNLF